MTAPGFCTCKQRFPDDPERFHPPAGATWHFLCDKPVLGPALGFPTDADLGFAPGTAGPADDGEGESVRIAEVFDQARTDLDRDN